MKYLVAAIVLACPFSARAAKLELEVGAGRALGGVANSWTGRVGLDLFEHLTPSVRVMTQSPIWGDTQTWALLGELRAHTRGTLQLTAGLGLGVATASVVRGPDATVRIQRVPTRYAVGDVGLRFMLGDFWLGGGVARSTGWDGYLATLSVGWAPLQTRK